MDFKCKTCEAQLTALAEEAQNGLVTCPYCKNVWTIPKKETSPAALSFLRMGEHDLDTCKFEDALSAYQKAAELDKEESEAYFGMPSQPIKSNISRMKSQTRLVCSPSAMRSPRRSSRRIRTILRR